MGSERDAMTSASSSTAAADGDGLMSVRRRWSFRGYFRALWHRREFAAYMPIEELRAQHMNTALGNLWHLLNPLLLTGVYYLIFGVLLNVDRGVDNFVTFLTIGVFTFHYTQKSIVASAKSIAHNEGLIRSLIFPRAILPLGSVVAQTVALGPAIAIVLFVALVTGVSPHWTWFVLVPLFAVQMMFNFGGSLLLARLTYRYRDLENLLPYVFRLAFYGSGVLYPVAIFVQGDLLRTLFDVNPLFGFVTIARWSIMGQQAPDAVNPVLLTSVGVWTVVGLIVGFVVFLRGEQEFGRA